MSNTATKMTNAATVLILRSTASEGHPDSSDLIADSILDAYIGRTSAAT